MDCLTEPEMDIRLEEIAQQVRSLREQAEAELRRINEDIAAPWMNFADMADSMTFPGDGTDAISSMWYGGFNFRTAFAMAFVRPTDTATAYITEAMRRMIVAASRAFCRINPYWQAIRQARIAYNVGAGHTYSIVARNPGEKVPKKLAQKMLKEVEDFIKANRYRQVQNEKLTRGDRDGEYFLKYCDPKDGILRVRFIEPIEIQTPTREGNDGVWFGIKFEDDNYEDPVGYYIRPLTLDGGALSADQERQWNSMIPADRIQRRTFNVDRSSPRGCPTTYALRLPLFQAVATGVSMAKQVDIRTRIAVIAKQVNATVGQIAPLLQRNRIGTVTNRGGQELNAFMYRPGSIVNTNDQRNYEFPPPNLETDKVVFSIKNDLQLAASAVGFADFVLSGDSKASYAGALVKQGPMAKAVGTSQADLIESDIEVLETHIQVAIDAGRLPGDALEECAVHAEAPEIVENRIQNAQADEIYVRNGALSKETMCIRGGFDPDVELPRAKDEKPNQQDAVGNGDTRSHQAPMYSKDTARAVPSGQEPGPAVNPQKAEEGFVESAHDQQSQTSPTQEDVSMAAKIITAEWLDCTKRELVALPDTGSSPRDSGVSTEYEPGIKGIRLGIADGQDVWAVDFDALGYKYNSPDLVVGANSFRWKFVPRNVALVDWVMPKACWLHILLHELVEQRLMDAGWAYARAHRYANKGPGCEQDWLVELRPELAALRQSR